MIRIFIFACQKGGFFSVGHEKSRICSILYGIFAQIQHAKAINLTAHGFSWKSLYRFSFEKKTSIELNKVLKHVSAVKRKLRKLNGIVVGHILQLTWRVKGATTINYSVTSQKCLSQNMTFLNQNLPS